MIVSRDGTGTNTTYSTNSIKEADVQEEFGIDTSVVEKLTASAKLYTVDVVQVSTKAQLRDVVESVTK